MDSERLQELAITVALGAADPAELNELQELLKRYPGQATTELAQARRLIASLAFAAPEHAPPAGLKQRLLRNVKTIEAVAAKSTATIRPIDSKKLATKFSLRPMRIIAWAAVFLLVALGYGNLSLREQLNRLRSQLDERQAEVAQLQAQLAQQQSIMQVVSAPRVQVVDLQSTKAERNSRGRVLIDRDAVRAIFLAENLPGLAADKDYELWYIAAQGAVPAGVFQVDANGAAIVEVTGLPEDVSGIHTFAVTLERKGGVPVPTLDQMVLAGKVSA